MAEENVTDEGQTTDAAPANVSKALYPDAVNANGEGDETPVDGEGDEAHEGEEGNTLLTGKTEEEGESDADEDSDKEDEVSKEKKEDDGSEDEAVEYDFTAVQESLGEEMKLNENSLEKLKELGAEHKWSQEVADQVVKLGAEHTKTIVEAQAQAYANTRAEWVKEFKEDPTLGGDDATVKKNLAIAVKGLDSFEGGDKVRDLLDETGMGDNPDILRFLHSVGLSVREDSFEEGAHVNTPKPKSHSEALYPSKAKAS